MNKEQLIAKAALKGGMTQREVRNGLNAVIEVLAEAFENDMKVTIAGLGIFQVKRKHNIKKYLPVNGKGPTKGVTDERAMFVFSDRRYLQFTPSLQIRKKFMGKMTRCDKDENDGKDIT